MNPKKLIKYVLPCMIFIITIGILFYSVPLKATVTFNLDYLIWDRDNPQPLPEETPNSTPPWATITIDSHEGGVLLDIDSHLTGNEVYGEFYLNLDTSFDINFDPLKLKFNFLEGENIDKKKAIIVDPDNLLFSQNLWDIMFPFKWLGEGEHSKWFINYEGGSLFESSFDAYSIGYPYYQAAAKIKGIELDDPELPEGSALVSTQPIPEPATLLLVGFGLIGIVGLKRRLQK